MCHITWLIDVSVLAEFDRSLARNRATLSVMPSSSKPPQSSLSSTATSSTCSLTFNCSLSGCSCGIVLLKSSASVRIVCLKMSSKGSYIRAGLSTPILTALKVFGHNIYTVNSTQVDKQTFNVTKNPLSTSKTHKTHFAP